MPTLRHNLLLRRAIVAIIWIYFSRIFD